MQRKIYARIKPLSYRRFSGEIFSEVYHDIFCEKIGRYSLGHSITFYESLEDAKDNFINKFPKKSSLQNSSPPEIFRNKDAIMELILDDHNQIINFGNIHCIDSYNTLYEFHQSELDESLHGCNKYYYAIWKEKTFNMNYTSGALEILNNLYKDTILNFNSDAPHVHR